MLLPFFRCLVSVFKTRRELALENLALQQQLAVLRRPVKRSRLSDFDRVFWVLLSRIWRGWRRSLVLVKPETVIVGTAQVSDAIGHGRAGGVGPVDPPSLPRYAH